MTHSGIFKKSILLLLCAFALSSFKAAYDEFSFTQSLATENLKSLNAEIRISAGKLNLTAQKVDKIDFKSVYSRDIWKPQFTSNLKSSEGTLSILQPEQKNVNMKDNDKNEWNIKLPQSLPTDLRLTMGAGEGVVNLNGANLKSLTMEAGAGDFKVNLANTSVAKLNISAGVGALEVDLSGKRNTNLKANISGGIGDVKVVLPSQVGIRATVSGLGSIKNSGLKKEGSHYVNDAYGKTPNSIDIDISGGLGSVELVMAGK